jgi:hypothetical protein
MGTIQAVKGMEQRKGSTDLVSIIKRMIICLLPVAILTSCAVSSRSYSPSKKYSPEQLLEDFTVCENVLKESHPGLYWYRSPDSMNYYFNEARKQLTDSMTEADFRKVLSFVIAKIGCGHTAVRTSKAASRYRDTSRVISVFPLSMKLWNDTAVVVSNLHRRDSLLTRGVMITRINGEAIPQITERLFSYLSTDGYNTTHKYQVLSNRGAFGPMYTSVYGLSRNYDIEFIDSTGRIRNTRIPIFNPLGDSLTRAALRNAQPRPPQPRPSGKERRQARKNAARFLRIDTTESIAVMDLNNFSRGYGLKKFFNRSFKALKQNNIRYLVIDVRNNGGGSPTNSTYLTRFLSDHRFKLGDSLYAISKRKKYGRYIKGNFYSHLYMNFFTRKKSDGNYHIGYFERHYFKPKKKNHYNGKTYIISGGNSFSATTLFISTVINQDNVTVVGEETGGGAYGNSAWHMPTVTLPQTKVRLTLPLYRLVINKDLPKTGRGVQPEVYAGPSPEAIRKGIDYKFEKVMQLIREEKNAVEKTNL